MRDILKDIVKDVVPMFLAGAVAAGLLYMLFILVSTTMKLVGDILAQGGGCS